jgi:hypothetical protein
MIAATNLAIDLAIKKHAADEAERQNSSRDSSS